MSVNSCTLGFLLLSRTIISHCVQPCVHFSGKARAWERIKPVGFPTAATVEAPAYYQNMESTRPSATMGFTKNADGTATFNFPFLEADDMVSFFDVNDVGRVASHPMHHRLLASFWFQLLMLASCRRC